MLTYPPLVYLRFFKYHALFEIEWQYPLSFLDFQNLPDNQLPTVRWPIV